MKFVLSMISGILLIVGRKKITLHNINKNYPFKHCIQVNLIVNVYYLAFPIISSLIKILSIH